MTRIVLLSDTHGYLDKQLLPILKECDEIWHAGDIGNPAVYDELVGLQKTLRAVSGNIDGGLIRRSIPEKLFWKVEERNILMTHIGGYPDKYPVPIKNLLMLKKPDIFVCGHSHILKIIFDKKLNLLYLNPGAAGKEGFHQIRTAIKFVIDETVIKDMAVIELGPRSKQIV